MIMVPQVGGMRATKFNRKKTEAFFRLCLAQADIPDFLET